jgi:hypothetical protein
MTGLPYKEPEVRNSVQEEESRIEQRLGRLLVRSQTEGFFQAAQETAQVFVFGFFLPVFVVCVGLRRLVEFQSFGVSCDLLIGLTVDFIS